MGLLCIVLFYPIRLILRAPCTNRWGQPYAKRTSNAHEITVFYGNLWFTPLFTAAFSQIHSVHALLYYVSNSLTSTTPLSPNQPCYVRFLHPNPVPFPALEPLAVHNSSPFTTFNVFVQQCNIIHILITQSPPTHPLLPLPHYQFSNTISLCCYLNLTDQIS